MKIEAKDLGKKFGKQWIFRNLNFTIIPGKPVALTGNNGSGKSTLLKILAGYLSPSQGNVSYVEENPDCVLVSPETTIIEEFTFLEFINFHCTFKKCLATADEISEQLKLPLNKPIVEFSTGMKQRVKLFTAFYCTNDYIFLDEPTSNFDNNGIEWFEDELKKLDNKVIVIASNIQNEIKLCMEKIKL